MTRAVAAALALAACSCSTDRVDVAPTPEMDSNRGAVLSAVAELRRAGHNPAAFRNYGDRILILRPGMDQTIAEEAELLTVTEAQVVMKRAVDEGVSPDVLALAVWPFGLAPHIAADVPGRPTRDDWRPWMPLPEESPAVYLERLCGGVLALECRDIVPEGQAAIVHAIAIERFTERTRRAVATCLTCSEPHWPAAIAGWEALDREANATVAATRRRYAPSRWPVAGEAAVDLPDQLPVIELGADARAERVRYALDDARKSGNARIALVAREPDYPYRRRAYLMSTAAGLPVRPGEPVQVLVLALDAAARRRAGSQPGADGK